MTNYMKRNKKVAAVSNVLGVFAVNINGMAPVEVAALSVGAAVDKFMGRTFSPGAGACSLCVSWVQSRPFGAACEWVTVRGDDPRWLKKSAPFGDWFDKAISSNVDIDDLFFCSESVL